MTISANINFWLTIELNLRAHADNSLLQLYVSNRYNTGLSSTTIYPLLLSVDDIGLEIQNHLPTGSGGTILINDNIGAFGVERKFSDLTEKYRFVGTIVKVYTSRNEITAHDYASGATLIYNGKIFDVIGRQNGQQAEFQINLERRSYTPKHIGQIVQTGSPQMSAAPARSVGLAIPLVIGTEPVYTQPILLNAEGSTSPIFAYACQMDDQFKIDHLLGIYPRLANNQYSTDAAVSASSNLIASLFGPDDTTAIFTPTSQEVAYRIDSAYDYSIITGGRWLAIGDGSPGAATGQIEITLYGSNDSSATAPPQFVLAKAIVEKAYYATDMGGSSNFYIDFTFDKAIFLQYAKHFISLRESGTSGYRYRVKIAGTYEQYLRDPTVATSQTWGDAVSGPAFILDLHGVEIVDAAVSSSDTDAEGYLPRRFTLTQAAPGDGQTRIDLSKLDFVCGVIGLLDDGSGTITGTANKAIKLPHEVVKLLSYDWDGSSWNADSTNWDHNTYSGTHVTDSISIYYRYITGWFGAQETVTNELYQVCRQSAGFIGISSTGKLGYYAWGSHMADAAIFTQENSAVTSFEVRAMTQVVNRVVMRYAPTLFGASGDLALQQSSGQTFAGNITWVFNIAGSLQNELIGTSQNYYGRRSLADITYDLIGDSTSAGVVARYLLTNFNAAPVYVTVQCPLEGNETLKLLDVVSIQSPLLPNFAGSAAATKPLTQGGYPVPIGASPQPVRAQTYRAQIFGKTVSLNSNNGPTIRLYCKLLLNYPKEPT